MVECLQLFRIRLVMYAVNKGLLLFPWSGLSDQFCYQSICQEHKLFYQFIGIFGFFEKYTNWFSGIINDNFNFHTVKVNGSAFKTLCSKFLSQVIENQDLLLHISFPSLDY